MNLLLADQLVLVTGSSSGIGLAAAREFLREGARVIVHSHQLDELQRALEQLRPLGSVHGLVADLASKDGADQLVRQVNAIGDVDVLINNVGIYVARDFSEADDDLWLLHFQLNLMSGVRLARALLPAMLERNRGRILFTSSEAGVRPMAEMIHYSVSKLAQVGLARGLAEITRGTRVTVNSIITGTTWTEGVASYFAQQGLDRPAATRQFFGGPLGINSIIQRFCEPEEIAAMLVTLASERLSAANGGAYRVEGGMIRAVF